MPHLGDHGALDRRVKIGIVKHDEGRIAAQLHADLQNPVGTSLEQDPPDLGRTGERHHAGRAVFGGRVEPRARRGGRHHVDQPSRHAGLLKQLGDPQRSQWGLLGRLDDACVASCQGGRDLARDHCGREVPWRHHHHNADRRMVDDDLVGPTRRCLDRAVDTHRLFAVPTEELGCVRDFTLGITEWLAVLEGDQGGEFVGVVDKCLPTRPQDLGSDPRRSLRPRSLRLVGRLDRRGCLGWASGRNAGDLVAGRRVGHRYAVWPVRPHTANQHLRLHGRTMARAAPIANRHNDDLVGEVSRGLSP